MEPKQFAALSLRAVLYGFISANLAVGLYLLLPTLHHGRKSMSWANRVLSVFMAGSGQKLGRLPETARVVQIDTTPHRSESRISHGFQRFNPSVNRTAVVGTDFSGRIRLSADGVSESELMSGLLPAN